jgi:transcriptional regulator with XRE-family HTH domain
MQLNRLLTDTSLEFVGKRLEVLRLALGKRPSQIAEDLDTDIPQWEHWESGVCPPSLPATIRLAERFDVSLDYIYRGDMSRLPGAMSRAIREVVSRIPETDPHPLWQNRSVRLLARWSTDADHRFTTNSALGGLIRDDQGRGVVYPYSPIGRTRWELSDGDPNSSFWRAHVADLDAHRPFHNFRYSFVSRGGRPISVVTNGRPNFVHGTFVGYSGTGRFLSMETDHRQVA